MRMGEGSFFRGSLGSQSIHHYTFIMKVFACSAPPLLVAILTLSIALVVSVDPDSIANDGATNSRPRRRQLRQFDSWPGFGTPKMNKSSSMKKSSSMMMMTKKSMKKGKSSYSDVAFPKHGKVAESVLFPMVIGKSDYCVSVLSNTQACNYWMDGYAVGIYYDGYLEEDGAGDVEPTACCDKYAFDMDSIEHYCWPTDKGVRSCVDTAPAPGAYVLINGANFQGGENLAFCCPF